MEPQMRFFPSISYLSLRLLLNGLLLLLMQRIPSHSRFLGLNERNLRTWNDSVSLLCEGILYFHVNVKILQ